VQAATEHVADYERLIAAQSLESDRFDIEEWFGFRNQDHRRPESGPVCRGCCRGHNDSFDSLREPQAATIEPEYKDTIAWECNRL